MSHDRSEPPANEGPPAGFVVRIAGEGRWLLPSAAKDGLRVLDNAVMRAVDEVREDEYERLLAGVRSFVRRQGERLEAVDVRGEADITVPPPGLPLAGAVDALFDGAGFTAEPRARPPVRAR
jgi:hypothetical protein